jgi:zinc transport system substrate-binding protein
VVFGTAFLAMACSGSKPADELTGAETASQDDAKLLVYTVNYPLQYFAERIGGDLVRVEFPAPTDGDPALWSPDPATVAAYQEADVILLNGASYAKWTDRVTLPPTALVNTSASFEDEYIYIESAVTHSHGPEAEHSHGQTAFTTWLDPTLAIRQADAIRSAFVLERPELEAAFQEGFASLERDLVEVDESLQEIFSGNEQPLLASHPVYQYLARRYAIDLRSVHFEPEEYPDEKSWRGLQELLVEHPANRMLWEGEPLDDTRKKLQELGIDIVIYDPCGNKPGAGDFLEVMGRNVHQLREVFTPVTSDGDDA